MNWKQYYEQECKKSWWQRIKDMNKPLKINLKEHSIRDTFEFKIMQTRNSKGVIMLSMLMLAGMILIGTCMIIDGLFKYGLADDGMPLHWFFIGFTVWLVSSVAFMVAYPKRRVK